VFIVGTHYAFAQKLLTTYLDSSWTLTIKEYAVYKRKGLIDNKYYFYDGMVKDYCKNGVLLMTGKLDAGQKSGMFTFYYPNGAIYFTGLYKDNKRDSIWTYYYPNGFIVQKIRFKDTFVTVTESFDSLGRDEIVNGNGLWNFTYYDDSVKQVVKVAGHLKDFRKHGTWKFWHKYPWQPDDDFELLTEETYENGICLKSIWAGFSQPRKHSILPESIKFEGMDYWFYDELASKQAYPELRFLPKIDSSYFPVNQHASYPGGVDSLLNEMLRIMKVPKEYADGRAYRIIYINFTVTDKGKIRFERFRGMPDYRFRDNAYLYERVSRALKKIKGWTPAVRNDRYVDSRYTLKFSISRSYFEMIIDKENKVLR
jgi:antitoxin component YwqK of YwqJK toxin-antitoxin module